MSPDLRSRLENALASSATEATARDLERCRAATGGALDRLVLVGAAQVGRSTAAGLRALGVEPLAFADNDPGRQGSTVAGLAVVSPEEAVERFGPDACYVATLFNPRPVLAQLAGLGCRRTLSYTVLYRGNPEVFLPYFGLDGVAPMLAQADDIRAAFDLFDDEASRRMLVEQVEWTVGLDPSALADPMPRAQTYQAPDLFTLTGDEVYVDCGAFDGDSIRAFLDRVGGGFAGIVAVEPDPGNAESLRRTLAIELPSAAERVQVHAVAAGDHEGRARFSAVATAGSTLADDGDADVQLRRLDDIVADQRPTYIKADVEGSELQLLDGARRLIDTGDAVWALTCYHAQDHLWQIPLRFAGASDKYRFHLRRYADDVWETVFYAVPVGRPLPAVDQAGDRLTVVS